MPPAALPALVEDVDAVYATLPAVFGPEPEASGFAELWAARHGLTARAGMRQRIFELERVVPPARPAPGRLRDAEPADLDLILEWTRAFSLEADVPVEPGIHLVESRIRDGAIFLWEDRSAACSMVAWSGRSPHGVRIGYVYTPPELRGRGYASAAVATASQRALDAGSRFCFLYTDLAKPTSNSIYQRLGYRPVADVVDFLFESPG